ncbi:DUF4304 domain-containing protein [Janthinobacterium sp. SUN100]|uniref:DUF4304 domain-containing protein n=1 Tax=Janthinobacterium sp. SUN100 TaxID=3004101 RepID=UPI0025B13E5B|nr:DUF4304 domain-containing protein [Janthinobacterium sp. SUN100]MDN2700410.1 DUF4304 domain-containing protein [Janthinobacterium sp. SUN100]
MKSINSKFLLELLSGLDDYFESEGFRRKKVTYSKNTEHQWQLVNWQISTDDLPGKIKFTINVGVHNLELAKILEEDGKPDVWDCHLRQRVGFLLPEHSDKWWIVDSTSPIPQALVDELRGILREYVMPFLSGLSAKDDLLDLWKTGVSPGKTDRQRLNFINLLEKSI